MTYNRYDFTLNKWSNDPADHYHFPQNKEQEDRLAKPGIGAAILQNIIDVVGQGCHAVGKFFTFHHPSPK
jgi:hypothetical protein